MRKLISACSIVLCTVAAVADEVKIKEMSDHVKITVIDIENEDRVANGSFEIIEVPEELKELRMVSVPRGSMSKPGAAFYVVTDRPAIVYLLVHNLGNITLPDGWKKTNYKVVWKTASGGKYQDIVYVKEFPAGKIEVPEHKGKKNASYGIPNAILLKSAK